MAYSWLFFDADGTLFDYDLAEARALDSTFRDFNLALSQSSTEAYRRINAQVWRDFEKGLISSEALRVRRFELLFEAAGVQADLLAFSARYLVNLSCASDLLPGAEETVRALHGRYHLALITNGLKDVQRPRLVLSPLNGLFNVIAISEEIGAAKPDPLYFERVFALAGNPQKPSVLVIGDSLSSDIQGGINYGLDTCWYNPTGKSGNPDLLVKYEIKKLEALKALLNAHI